MMVIINGSNFSNDEVYFEENQMLFVECRAQLARPAANMTLMVHDWGVRKTHFEDYFVSCEENGSSCDTFGKTTILVDNAFALVECIGRGQFGYNEQRVYANISTYGKFTKTDRAVYITSKIQETFENICFN